MCCVQKQMLSDVMKELSQCQNDRAARRALTDQKKDIYKICNCRPTHPDKMYFSLQIWYSIFSFPQNGSDLCRLKQKVYFLKADLPDKAKQIANTEINFIFDTELHIDGKKAHYLKEAVIMNEVNDCEISAMINNSTNSEQIIELLDIDYEMSIDAKNNFIKTLRESLCYVSSVNLNL